MRRLKQALSILLAMALLSFGPVSAKPLSDFADYDAILNAAEASSNRDAMLEATQLLSDVNAIGGDGKNLHLQEQFTRAQFAALVYKFATGKADMTDAEKLSYNAANVFTDMAVGNNTWATPYVNWAATKGYVNGVGNGKFAPARVISQAEAVILLGRVLGFDASKSNVPAQKPTETYTEYMETLAVFIEGQFNIIRSSYAMSSAGITRGEAFVFFVNALEAPRITYDKDIGKVYGKTYGETSYGLQTVKGVITATYYAKTAGTVMAAKPEDALLTLSEVRSAGSLMYPAGTVLTVALPAGVAGLDTYAYLGREVTVTVRLASTGDRKIETQYGTVTKTANNYETVPLYDSAARKLTWRNAKGNEAALQTSGAGFGTGTRGAVTVIQNGSAVSDGAAVSVQASFTFISRNDSESGVVFAFGPTIAKVVGPQPDALWTLQTLNNSDHFGTEVVNPSARTVNLKSSDFIAGAEHLAPDAVIALQPAGRGKWVALKTVLRENVKSSAIMTGKSITADGITYAVSELPGSCGGTISASDVGGSFDLRLFGNKVVDFEVLSNPAGVGVVYASIQNGTGSLVFILKKDGTTFAAQLDKAGRASQRGSTGVVWTPDDDGPNSRLEGTVPSGSTVTSVALPLNITQGAVLVHYTLSEDGSTVTINRAAGDATTYDYYMNRPDYIRIAAYDGGADRFLTASEMIPVFEAAGPGLAGGVTRFTANNDIGADTRGATAYVLRNSQNAVIGAITVKRTTPVVASAAGLYRVIGGMGPVTVDGSKFIIQQPLYDIATGFDILMTYVYDTASDASSASAFLPVPGSFVRIYSPVMSGYRTELAYATIGLNDFYAFTVANLSGSNFYDASAHRFDLSKATISIAVKNGNNEIIGYAPGTVDAIKKGATIYLAINSVNRADDTHGIPAVLVDNH